MATSHAWGKVIENRVHSVHLIISSSYIHTSHSLAVRCIKIKIIKEHKYWFINISFNHLKDICKMYICTNPRKWCPLQNSMNHRWLSTSNTMSTSTSHWNLWCASFNDIISISMLVTRAIHDYNFFLTYHAGKALIALKWSLCSLYIYNLKQTNYTRKFQSKSWIMNAMFAGCVSVLITNDHNY